MKNKHQKLLSWYKAKGCTFNFKINLDRLFKKAKERELECAKKFVTSKGAVVAFQKNAWNNLCSENDPKYDIKLARAGKLKGHLKGDPRIPLLCVPPTRLSGPCSRVLKKIIK